MHPCCNSVVKVNLTQVCASFSWSVLPKYGMFAEMESGGSRGGCGGREGFGGRRGTAGKTLGETASENNCEY